MRFVWIEEDKKNDFLVQVESTTLAARTLLSLVPEEHITDKSYPPDVMPPHWKNAIMKFDTLLRREDANSIADKWCDLLKVESANG